MARLRKKSDLAPAYPAAAALYALDLADWAGERVARAGRDDALLGRVESLHLALDGRVLEALVRGNRPLPYRVQVDVQELRAATSCTCSREQAGPCRHAVAAVEALRFPARRARAARRAGRVAAGRGRIVQPAAAAPGFVIIGGAERTRTRDERLEAARAEALESIRARARRSRTRIEAIPQADGGPPCFSVAPRAGELERLVAWREAGPFGFTCTCEEFGENELGTCPHVERVRSRLNRGRLSARPAPVEPQLQLAPRAREWIDAVPRPLEELRLAGPLADGRLAEHFGPAGWLRASPDGLSPSAWARRAVAAVRAEAERMGQNVDLDPAVARLIEESEAVESLARTREAAVADGATWQAVLGRLGLRLHPYQLAGAQFLVRTGRAFLADDMGLGKTVQAVVAALVLRERAGAARALVVCPASLKHQWRQEIGKICGETARVVDGHRAERLKAYAECAPGFLVVNYELVLRDLEALCEARFDLVILDEAQRIKNWGTKTARAVKRLASPHAFVLTGTPLENRLLELHSLVEFLHRRAAGPRWRMVPFHEVTDGSGRVIAYEGLDVLRGRLRGFFLRRERRDVQHELPERTDNTFWTAMTPTQLRPYRKHAAAAAAILARRASFAADELRALLRSLTAMRILCNAHAQYAWDDYAGLLTADAAEPADVRALASPKLEEFVRVLDDLLEQSDEKVVVFSHWERMLRLAEYAVRDVLKRRDLRAEVFHGGLDGRARTQMLEAFARDAEFRVLFSTDAGGLGLNLQAASIVVNLEVPWNPAVLEQRIGRVHRMGQRRSVQVLHFVARGTIEERVRQVLESKRALFEGLLVEDADTVVLDDPGGSGWIARAQLLLAETNGD